MNAGNDVMNIPTGLMGAVPYLWRYGLCRWIGCYHAPCTYTSAINRRRQFVTNQHPYWPVVRCAGCDQAATIRDRGIDACGRPPTERSP